MTDLRYLRDDGFELQKLREELFGRTWLSYDDIEKRKPENEWEREL